MRELINELFIKQSFEDIYNLTLGHLLTRRFVITQIEFNEPAKKCLALNLTNAILNPNA